MGHLMAHINRWYHTLECLVRYRRERAVTLRVPEG
jgi:hypothetical protein